MNATTIRLIGPIVLATVLGTLVACGGSEHVQKSGGATDRAVTLTLAMPDGDDPLGNQFAKAVARRSGGSVRLRRNPHDYSSVDPANEVALAKDLERGRADVGYLPARAWAAAGVGTFRVLLAPFVVTTDAAAQTLANSPVAGEVLATLPSDVVGLSLVPAQARRLLASKPAVRPGDYAGLRLRIVDNPQTAATFSALGATPVQGLTAHDVSSALERREINGAETSPDAILSNNYTSYVRDLSGYGLFPKYQSIVLSRRAWERLSDGQRSAIQRAAQDIVAAAKTAVPKRAADDLQQLCNAKVRIVVPTNAQLQSLVAAAQPAIDELGSKPASAALLHKIRALPGTGARRLAAPLPTACTSPAKPASQRSPATIPEGTYEVRVTAKELASIGATGQDFSKDITSWIQFKDGRFVTTQKPTFPDQCAYKPTKSHPACVGTYKVDGDQLTFTWEPPTPPPVPAPETVTWSYFNGALHFKPTYVGDPVSRLIYEHAWRKVR
jgi:TRAP-type C4-dicarboxylate transport system substrate-binding protein